MSANTSFVPVLPSPFIHSLECSRSRTSMLNLLCFSIINILLILPLAIFVLYLGYQRWRQQHFTPTAVASHSDIFTYHILVMEMITVLACLLYCVGACADLPLLMMYSLDIFSSTWCVKIHFHSLTCVERYLAVVHPVTYLNLKNKGGARVRNITIGCVWLLCLVWGILIEQSNNMVITIVYLCLVGFALLVICFCCISVLCALRGPAPGELRRDGERVDQMKRRAFNTIGTIMGVLLLCLGGMVLGNTETLQQLSERTCVVMTSSVWFSLPSSLVLPLLYLHRVGKVPRCKHNSESDGSCGLC